MTGKIHFDFEGTNYVVGMDAYDKGGPIILPDNTVLTVGGWFETFPPQPDDLRRSTELKFGATAEESARLMNGHLAEVNSEP